MPEQALLAAGQHASLLHLQVYRLLKETSSIVQPISCDEAFMDITALGEDNQIISALRAKIKAATGITASAGIGPNMLLARLATKRAKPNGQFNISSSQVSVEVPSEVSLILTLAPQRAMSRWPPLQCTLLHFL